MELDPEVNGAPVNPAGAPYLPMGVPVVAGGQVRREAGPAPKPAIAR